MTFALTVEIDFVTDPADEPDAWTDLTGRRRGDVTVRYGTGVDGQCSVRLSDPDRDLDPTNPTSPFTPRPMRHARVMAHTDGASWPVFRGFVEDWTPRWERITDDEVTVTIVPASAWLALQEVDVDLPAAYTGARIDALLNAAGWPTALRDLDPGQVLLEPFDRESANLWRLTVDAVSAEAGWLWIAPDGTVTFRDRHSRLAATQEATVGRGGIATTSSRPTYSAAPLTNIVRVELEDGRVFEAVDEDSKEAYGPRSWSYRDLDLTGVEAFALGQWDIVQHAEPSVAIDAVDVNTARDPDQVLALQPGARVAFVAPSGLVDPLDQHLEVVRHRIGRVDWATTLELSPYFGAGPWLTWDDEGSVGYSDIYTDIYEATPVGDDEAWDEGRWAP